MTWDDEPAAPAMGPPGPDQATKPRTAGTEPIGFRRAVLTAGMAAALLVTGGVAIVAAASPEPSASTAPGTTSDPSSGGSTDTSPGDGRAPAGAPSPATGRCGPEVSGATPGPDDSQSSQPTTPTPVAPTPSTATPLT